MYLSELKDCINNSFKPSNIREYKNVNIKNIPRRYLPACTIYKYNIPPTLDVDLDLDEKQAETKICQFVYDSTLNDPEFVDKKYILWRSDPKIEINFDGTYTLSFRNHMS